MVAIKYRSDDPPDKMLDFYRKQLKAYGEVSECHGSVSFEHGKMRCTGLSSETNLVAGTEDRHRIVSVKPEGKGSNFALVYVQTRGERGTLVEKRHGFSRINTDMEEMSVTPDCRNEIHGIRENPWLLFPAVAHSQPLL